MQFGEKIDKVIKTKLKEQKTKGKISKKVKHWLLIFNRKFFDPNLQYTDKLIEQWTKSLVQLIISVILNGFVFYLALRSFTFIFPSISQYIYLGTRYWEIPIFIFFLGWLSWFIKGFYKWFRLDYKKGGII